jgi:hypothetical protein
MNMVSVSKSPLAHIKSQKTFDPIVTKTFLSHSVELATKACATKASTARHKGSPPSLDPPGHLAAIHYEASP